MYADIPVSLAVVFVVSGLALLAWRSDRFVAGSAALAKNLGVSPFVIGMVVIGFGTSAPELLVSAFSGASGHSNLSLGNAYGSCFFNIAGILGVAALVKPIVVKKSIPRFGVPVLLAISAVSYILIRDGSLSRIDAAILLVIFAITMPLYCFIDRKGGDAAQDGEEIKEMSFAASLAWSLAGLVVMIGASHLLVWGSVDLARSLGVSELMIGLTVVAIGTSLPELASALAASRRGESELVLGNIIGSNIFNMLAVVGIAGAISPIEKFSPCVLGRDLPVLAAATLSLGIFGLSFRPSKPVGSIGRVKGAFWLLFFFAYMAIVIAGELLPPATRSARFWGAVEGIGTKGGVEECQG
jgi:cation:H+ antiporter